MKKKLFCFNPTKETLIAVIVGILYVTVVSISNNPICIYPFFWGVGATLDVLIQSKVVDGIELPGLRSLILTVVFVVIFLILRKRNENVEGEDKVIAS